MYIRYRDTLYTSIYTVKRGLSMKAALHVRIQNTKYPLYNMLTQMYYILIVHVWLFQVGFGSACVSSRSLLICLRLLAKRPVNDRTLT